MSDPRSFVGNRSWHGTLPWLLAAILSLASTSQALDIAEYDRLPAEGQVDFTVLLVQGVTDWLAAHDRSADAETLAGHFGRAGAQPDAPGLLRWKVNLQFVREMNVERKATRKPAYTVEHAFALTLKEAGVRVSPEEILATGHRLSSAPQFRVSQANSPQIR